ncbi:hypothetical protein ACFL30_03135, partial [Candidatus Latescibacterota bacterium]
MNLLKKALLIFSLLLSPCCIHGTLLAAEKQDLANISVEELSRILEVAETDEKIRVLDELRDRGQTASTALPIVVQIGVEIMAAYPSDPSDWDSYQETIAPFFPVLWTISSIGNAQARGASQAAEFLVGTLRYRDGKIPFQGDHIDIVERALISLDRSALVALARSLRSHDTYSNSIERVLSTIANKMVIQKDTEGLQELRKAQNILDDLEDARRGAEPTVKRVDTQWDKILPSSIQALESIQREGTHKPTIIERSKGLLYIVGSVFLLNLAVILLATKVRWARTIVFHPVGAHVLGLVVGKYMLIDFAMHFITPIRLAMFRDYRTELTKRLIEFWAGRFYIHPQVDLSEGTSTESNSNRTTWQSSLETIMKSQTRGLWLIQGESGLGKTALLEQWSMFALRAGQTPILLRLGGGLRVEEELSSILLQYGDLTMKTDVARNLINAGGFLVLLDAFNEDLHPTATREFVRHAMKNNHVVITSQIRPDWDRLFTVREIYLRPFGREQLADILPANWVDQILAQNYLSQIVALPYTAQLLAQFIKKNDELPLFRVDLYDDMFGSLEELADRDGLKAMVPNLYDNAARLFFRNCIFFDDDDRVPSQLCTRAIEAGVLTRTVVESAKGVRTNYRFAHELIHRYCVALYLDRQEKSELDTWHSQVEPKQLKTYWENVLDFWGELQARRVSRSEAPIESYESFLRDTAEFSSDIFSRKMYLQAD